MSKVQITCRYILSLSLYFLLLTYLAPAADAQVKFTNLNEKYNELRVEPVLTNEGNQPVSVRTLDGMVDFRILYLDKRTGAWRPWQPIWMCGNVERGEIIILPGKSEPLPLFWGIQAERFGVKPPPRTEYKLVLTYTLEPEDAAGKPERRIVESAPFRLELSKGQKRLN